MHIYDAQAPSLTKACTGILLLSHERSRRLTRLRPICSDFINPKLDFSLIGAAKTYEIPKGNHQIGLWKLQLQFNSEIIEFKRTPSKHKGCVGD